MENWGRAPAGRSDLVRLALRLIVEEAFEGEVADVLGRERYARGDGEKSGYRNGYRTGKVKTAEGAVDYSAPQVRETSKPFVSRLRAALSGRTQELERLAVERYARGLSTRDIEDAFTDEAAQRLLSRTTVSEITERLWAQYEAFCQRDLSEHDIVYLFIDGIAERLPPGQRREAVLAAWGVGADGRKVLLALMAGSKEDAETVRAFFQDMRARGHGAPGIIRAIEDCLPALGAPALAWRTACATFRSRSRPTCGRNSSRVFPPAIRRPRAPSPVNSPAAFAPTTLICCRARSPVLRTTSRPASFIRACRSRTAASFEPPICLSGCSSRSAGASRSSPTALERNPCSNSCSALSSAPPSVGAACASPSSSYASSQPSERSSTTNIKHRSRRRRGHPNPLFPANPRLDEALIWRFV